MANRFKSTVEFRVWKEHTCVRCGAIFRYPFQRQGVGHGRTQRAASAAADRAAGKVLAAELETHPCPACGLIQPDMIGTLRLRRHRVLFWLTALALGLVYLLGAAELISSALTVWLAGGVAACVLVGHVLVVQGNPNRDLRANQRQGQAQVEAGGLVLSSVKVPDPPGWDRVDWGSSPAQVCLLVLMGLSILVLLWAELVPLACGWPANPEWSPRYAGPADTVRLRFPESVSSLKGHWKAEAHARVLNAEEVGLEDPVLAAHSRQEAWDEYIRFSARERENRSTLWARVQLPEDPELSKQTLQVRVDLDVNYPRVVQEEEYKNASAKYSHTSELRLAWPLAARWYRAAVVGGLAGGSLLLLGLSVALALAANGLRRRALPTSIFVPETTGGTGERFGAQARRS